MPPLTLNVQASQSALTQSIAQGIAAFNNRYAGRNQLNLQINAKSFTRPLGAISNNLRQFEQSLAASNARVIAFGASTAVIGGVAKTFKDLAVATIEVEKALTDVNRVFGLSTENLQRFSKELFTISRQTASSFAAVAEAALEFSRQGLSTEETLRRVNDALVLTRLTGTSTAQAVEQLTAVVNAYSSSALNTSEVLNKIVAVEQRFAVSAADLTVAVSRTGQAAQEAGVNFDELNALVTAVQERTARGGAVIGNALKTIFTRLGRTETLDQLEQFNIAVRDISGNVLPAVDILTNLANSYQNLSDTTRASLAEQVAGVYQVNILKSLLSDLADRQGAFTRALEIGKRATNEATVANAQLNTTLSALISQTGTDLLRLGNNIGKATFDPVFRSLIKPFDDALIYINNLLEGEGIGSDFANGLLKGIKNVIAGPGVAAISAIFFKLASNTFKDVSSAIPSILGVSTQAQRRKNLEEGILNILSSQNNISRALLGQNGNLVAQQQTLFNLAKAQTDQYLYQLSIAKQLAPLLAARGVNVGNKIGFQVGRISGGFIPNFAGGNIPGNLKLQEIRGALAGGYTPGTVVAAPKSVGGIMNTAEKVKHVSGFSQPFINPPQNSKAGINHRIKSITSIGVDPYRSGGYIPKFSASGNLPDFSVIGMPLSSRSGSFISHKKIDDAINTYIKSINLLTTNNAQVSQAITKLLPQFKLNQQSFNDVRRAAIDYAKAKRSEIQNQPSRLTKFNSAFNKAAVPIAFGLPLLSGFAEQAVFGGRSRLDMTSRERGAQSLLSSGVAAVGTSAAIGSAFGPVGTGIGAAAGLIAALAKAANDTRLSLEELIEVNNKQKQQNQEIISGASSYITAQKQLNDAILSGASADEIAIASQKLSKNFLDIKDTNLQEIFYKAGSNIKEMTDRLEEYTKEVSRETSFKDFLLGEKLTNKESALALFSGVKDSPEKAKSLRSAFLQALTAQEGIKTAQQQQSPIATLSESGLYSTDTKSVTDAIKNYETSLSTILELGGITKDDSEEYAKTLEQLKKTIEKRGIVGILEELRKVLKITEAKKEQGQDKEFINLFNLRNKLNEEFTQKSNQTILKLKNNEFSRKLEKDLFDFQQSLSESFVSPLERISKNLEFQSSILEKEYLDEVSKLNNEFATKIFKDIKDKISNPFALERISGVLEKARSGDFSEAESLLGSKRFETTAGPSGFLAFKEAIIDYRRATAEAKQNFENQLKAAKQDSDIESAKAQNIQNALNLVKQEISLNGLRERNEILRKTNIELEIDAIERSAADSASLLGRGVEGKAAERNRFRNLILQKKLQDDEITKARSAQQEYNKVLEVQRQILIDQGAQNETRKFLPMELKTREDIQKATEQISKITFVDAKQEEDRVATLESLRKVQQEILSGKIKEEEITRRINEEESRNAKRARSFGYGFREGIDEIRDEVDTFENRLGRTLPNAFKDGIVGALDAAINKTDDLNEAMLEVASSFLRTIQNAMFEQIAGTLVSGAGSLMKRQRGGVIRAQNGMYISGGRTGDKNPALLEDGEYVLNRNAVKAFGGPSVLNQLNFGSFPRFAGGGANINMGEPFSSLSEYGKENSPEYQAYVDRLREAEAIKQAKKAKEKALINQLISTAITSAVAVGFSSVSRGGMRGTSNPLKTPQSSPYSGNTAYAQIGGLMHFNNGGYLPYGSRLNDTIPAMLSGGEYIVNSRAVRKYGVGGLNRINAGVPRYQDGGMVGSSTSPTVGNTTSSTANNVSINITVNASGGKMEGEQTNVSGARNEDGNAKLAGKIKEVVLQVITNEQRTGGLLDSTKKK